MANYLKDRNSYITVRSGPNDPAPIFSKDNVFEKKVLASKIFGKMYVCHCGMGFDYYDEIKKHRRVFKHFVNRSNNYINNNKQ